MKYPVSHLTPFPPIFPHVPRANSLLAFTPNPPLCQARRMPLCFHHLTNPSLPQPFCIDFLVIHFQLLTNPFSRNPFTFTSIQNPRVSPPPRAFNFRLSIAWPERLTRRRDLFNPTPLQRRKAPYDKIATTDTDE